MQRLLSLTLAAFIAFWANAASAAPISRVNVMPDRQVRPGVALPVFGSADGGVGTHNADGSTYTWTFTFNALFVTVAPGNVASTGVTNDRYINTLQTFTLIGSTRQTVTATLTVTNGVTSQSKSVLIDVVDPTDPISNTALGNLQVNVNIAIENGLRAMYLQQDTSSGGFQYGSGGGAGSAGGSSVHNCATTGFSVWAFSNSGHRPTNSVASDIYSEWVQRGVDYILNSAAASVAPGALNPPFYARLTFPADVDGNANGRLISLCGVGISGTSSGSPDGYASPIAAAGIEAAYSANPAIMHTTGPFAGSSYFNIIQDAVDWSSYVQMEGVGIAGGCGAGLSAYRGGWRYTVGDCDNADTSIESWHYVALEGFEEAFLGKASENVKLEAERRLDSSQYDGWNGVGAPPYANGSYGRFGYAYDTHLVSGSGHENAKTAGGLSGLNMVTHCNDATLSNCTIGTHTRTPFFLDSTSGGAATATARFSGGVPATTPGSFGNVVNRKTAALRHLGFRWSTDNSTVGCDTWSRNRDNPYAMWTTARALRLNGTTQLINGATTFDWQTGETTASPGVVPGPGPLEGYFPYLVRTQTGTGLWSGDCSGYYPANMFTAMAILILQPKVFPAAGNCDNATASVATAFYPLDHGLRGIVINGLPSGTPAPKIDEVCQDENPTGEAIPAYSQDASGIGTTSGSVRAEVYGTRSVPSNGRVYHIYFTSPQLQCSKHVTVGIPNPYSAPIIDGGPLKNSVTNGACSLAGSPSYP